MGVLLLAPRVQSQWVVQDISLAPGWNGIHLQVQPALDECSILFSNTPVEKVFWWKRAASGMEFDLDPRDPFPRTADWEYWFADNPALGTFGKLMAGESYVIRVSSNAAPFTLRLTGKPVLNGVRWIANESNLAGLPVSTNPAVSFLDFFSFSPHFTVNSATATIFRITGAGDNPQRIWNPATETIRPGEAYWIKAGAQARDYAGPIAAELDNRERLLDFGASTGSRILVLKNLTATNRLVQIAHLASEPPPAASGGPALLGKTPLLVNRAFSDELARPLPDLLVTNISAGGRLELNLAPDPVGLTNGTPDGAWQSVLRITDRDNASFPNAMVDLSLGVCCDGAISSQLTPQGLWVGRVTVTDVERAATREGVLDPWFEEGPVPVSRPFTYRIILHVDDAGNVRLLQRALLANDASNTVSAILGSETAAAAYAAQHPDARIARISTPCFPPMDPLPATNGVFGASLAFQVKLNHDDPVNPFLHRYHPKHDGLRYDNGVPIPLSDGAESYTVERDLQLQFVNLDPVAGTTNRQWGVTESGGHVEETVSGLNKTLRTRGTFRLERVNRVGSIN